MMLVLLYSLGKASFTLLGRLFDTWPSQVYRWVVQEGLSLPEQEDSGEIKEMEVDAFMDVLPVERHVVGKAHTVTIERDNSNTRHHLGGFTRRTKIVSKKAATVDLSLKLWQS